MLNCFSHVWLFVTSWTVTCQAPLSMGFSRQEYGSGLPFPSPGDLPDPGIEPGSPAWRQSPALQADSLPPKPSRQTSKPKRHVKMSTLPQQLGSVQLWVSSKHLLVGLGKATKRLSLGRKIKRIKVISFDFFSYFYLFLPQIPYSQKKKFFFQILL